MPRRASPYPRITVEKRGEWYSLRISHQGKRWRESTGTDRRSDADAHAKRRYSELADGAGADLPEAPQAAYSLDDAIAAYLEGGVGGLADGTVRMYKVKCGHLGRLLGGRDISGLSIADVAAYMKRRQSDEEGASAHTVAKEIVALRRVLALAEEGGLVTSQWRASIPRKVKTGYVPRDRWLDEQEVAALMAAFPEKRRLWLLAAIYTGARDSELASLTWRHVDLRTGFIAVTSAKVRHGDKKVRQIPLAAPLRAALEAIPVQKRSGRLLPAYRNGALMVTKWARRAGIIEADECLSPNDLRRTFCSWLLQAGRSVEEAARLLGHGSTAMVQKVYGHLARRNLVDAVAALPDFGPLLDQKRPGGPA